MSQSVPVFIVDAFTHTRFAGNPAAVYLAHESVPSTEICQKIATEFNLSETAFPFPIDTKLTFATANRFSLRWFTPLAEVPLCGHATLATAHVIFNELNNANSSITFTTKSGDLTVRKSLSSNMLTMNFPQYELCSVDNIGINADKYRLHKSMKVTDLITDLVKSIAPLDTIDAVVYTPKAKDLIVILHDNITSDQFQHLKVSADELMRIHPTGETVSGVIITVKASADRGFIDCNGKVFDFASRYIVPWFGVREDPATGAAHCSLAPFWSEILDQKTLYAHQSFPGRGAEFHLQLLDDKRVELTGAAVTVFNGNMRPVCDK